MGPLCGQLRGNCSMRIRRGGWHQQRCHGACQCRSKQEGSRCKRRQARSSVLYRPSRQCLLWPDVTLITPLYCILQLSGAQYYILNKALHKPGTLTSCITRHAHHL